MWTVHGFPAGLVLFAQIGQLWQWDVCLPVGAMVGVVALGVWAIIKVKRWREEDAVALDDLSINDSIAQYEQLAEDGLIDPEELARIKARLTARFDEPQPTRPLPNQPPDTSIQEK